VQLGQGYDVAIVASRGKNVRRKVEKIAGKLPSAIHVDHVKPIADGGSNTLKNLQLLPEKAHQLKTAVENAARAKTGRRGRIGKSR